MIKGRAYGAAFFVSLKLEAAPMARPFFCVRSGSAILAPRGL
jgi:hypothetical protein